MSSARQPPDKHKKIAKIMKNGKIKGLKKGKCKIEVKNGKRTMKYTIRVNSVKKKKII